MLVLCSCRIAEQGLIVDAAGASPVSLRVGAHSVSAALTVAPVVKRLLRLPLVRAVTIR